MSDVASARGGGGGGGGGATRSLASSASNADGCAARDGRWKAASHPSSTTSRASLAASGMTAALWAAIGGAPLDVDRDVNVVDDDDDIDVDDDDDGCNRSAPRLRSRGTSVDDVDERTGDGWTASQARRRAAKAFASTSDVELYAARCALARLTQTESRAILSAALAQWKLACGRRVANARVARAMGRRARGRVLRRFFNRWRVQIPTTTTVVGHMGWTNREGFERSTYIAGLANGAGDDESDEEFPMDYRAELEIRLTQISRLEEALRIANAKAEHALGEKDVNAQMDKFRTHLTNLQRELENVKRERDAYKVKYAEASAAASGAKSQAERRLNQRTMSTQTTFTSEDTNTESKPAPAPEPTPKELKKIEDQWMGTAQQFQKKFERQMEISNDLEKRLREERTRLMKTEAKYEAKLDEMRAKHDAAIAEVFARTESRGAEVNHETFEAYAAIGKQRATMTTTTTHLSPEPQPMIRSSSIDMFRTPSNGAFKSPRPSTSASDATGEDVTGASPAEFQTAKKLHFGAALDDLTSSDDELGHEAVSASDSRAAPMMPSPYKIPSVPASDDARRQPMTTTPAHAKKPIRLTVAVAKLVMLGHSQRDAIEALKHVDGNDVHAALDWIAARKRATV